MLAQEFRVENELKKSVHFDWFLGLNELAEILELQFVEAEEGEVGEDGVHGGVIAVGAGGVELEENFDENFEELLVTDAAVEDLLDEYFLVGVLELWRSGRRTYFGEEGVAVRVDRAENGVVRFDALSCVFN